MTKEKSRGKYQLKSPVSNLGDWRGFDEEALMYALFEQDKQIGSPFPTEKEVWEAALIEGLVTDIPVADQQGGQVLPGGYHVAKVDEEFAPRPDWKLPREIT